MKDYFKVSTADEPQLNAMLRRGWEVIEVSKSRIDGDEYVTYHIGFPIKKAFELALEVLHEFDKHDLRLSLLESVANEINASLDDYEPTTRLTSNEHDDVIEIFEKTDFLMSGVDFPKYQKRKKEEIDFEF